MSDIPIHDSGFGKSNHPILDDGRTAPIPVDINPNGPGLKAVAETLPPIDRPKR